MYTVVRTRVYWWWVSLSLWAMRVSRVGAKRRQEILFPSDLAQGCGFTPESRLQLHSLPNHHFTNLAPPHCCHHEAIHQPDTFLPVSIGSIDCSYRLLKQTF
jgi:hypothetical protein